MRDDELTSVAAVVAAVPDPEIPSVTIEDLGVLRSIERDGLGRVVVTVTPTYSGCPAIEAICAEIYRRLAAQGYESAIVRTALAPAWTTDWISDEGRRKLRQEGIAPPGTRPPLDHPLLQLSVACPRCRSLDTRLVSTFGSTACMAHYVCNKCAEPFDHFKAI